MRNEHQTYASTPPSEASAPVTKQQKNSGYVIAGVGAGVALYAFYSLPFVAYYTSIDPNSFTPYNPQSVTANGFDQPTQFSMVLTIITLILAALLFFSNNPSGANKTSSVRQRRRTVYAMIGMSVLSILIYVYEVIRNSSNVVPFDRIETGFWVYLLGIGTVIIGSLVALFRLRS
jgi:RsiW-degrading membrane proteinase PrsW (M82 family)